MPKKITRPVCCFTGLAILLLVCSCKILQAPRHRQGTAQFKILKGGAYYLNVSGDDQHDGTKANPWKTIDKLNRVRLKPGDTVYLQGGQVFPGTLLVSAGDSGAPGKPVVITSYGPEPAVIDGGDSAAIQIRNTANVEIRKLRMKGSGRKTGNTENGLAVINSTHIRIDSAGISGFQKAGLLIYKSDSVKAVHVYAHENGFAGISVSGDYGSRDCRDVYIGYCIAADNPGDPANKSNHSGNGIIAGYCKNVKIEYCTATNNGWDMPRKGNGPVGIWAYEADSVVIQHCLSYRNKTSAGGGDGGGFDLDGGVTHSLIQYCLSYENQGSGYGIFQYSGAAPWHDNTFRFNISENDGNVSAAGAGVYIWNNSGDSAQFKNCLFYNNVIYNAHGAAIHFDRESVRKDFRFYNNIFVAADGPVRGRISGDQFLANDWWSLAGLLPVSYRKSFRKPTMNLFSYPAFPNPGNASIISATQLASFLNYQLAGTSWQVNGANLLEEAGIDNGGLDFNGHPAPSNGIGSSFKSSRVYYIDSRKGNDANNGQAPGEAWKTLDKADSEVFHPGDRILLKRNEIFSGSLLLHGSGTREHPILLRAYGTGKRPVIAAGGRPYAVNLTDEQYWEIADLETSGGEKAGIFIGSTKDHVALNHFRITDCYVHDVGNDSVYTYDYSTLTGGIVVANGAFINGKAETENHTALNDVIIDGCQVKYIKRWTCISISSGYGNKGNANYIRNCTTAYSVADAIRMNGVKNSYIESCVMYKNGAWPECPNPRWGGLGAWFFGADNCTIQYCEASGIASPHQDAGAFDIDYWQENSTVQYCYGHDCYGYGVSVFGADSSQPTVNSVIRDNIFSNNGREAAHARQGDIYIFTWNKGLLNGVKVYNNISYWNPAANAPAININADFTGKNPDLFENNIVCSDSSRLVYRKNNRVQFDDNIYHARNGMPLWIQGEKKYHSLADWQKATAQDMHSRYVQAKDSMLLLLHEPVKNKPVHGAHSRLIRAGAIAPDFAAKDFEGKKVSLKYLRGSCILLSFIKVSNSNEAARSRETRAQLVFLKSMARQYGKDGLKIILIDSSPLKYSLPDTKGDLINFICDHDIAQLPLITGKTAFTITKNYGVHVLPTTFLINASGRVSQSWEHTALSSQLAFALIEQINKKSPHYE